MQAERTYLWTVVGAGALALVAALVAAARDPSGQLALDPLRALVLVVLGVGSWLVLRNLLLLRWRGQHVALAPDETLVVVALAALSPVQTLLFALPAMTIFQVATKRVFLKGAFNVAALTLATGAGVLAHVALTGAGAPSLVATLPAVVVYTTTTHMLVSGVFALRERASPLRVFRERFLVPTALHVAMGLGGGFALLALWSLHPLAVLALAPFVWLARENMQLAARAEREAEAQRSLGRVSHELVGTADVQAASGRVLEACGPLFRAGRVEIRLDDGTSWTRDFEDGPRLDAPLEARLPAHDGLPGGVLRAFPSARTHEAWREADVALLHVVAGEAASALAHAQALRTLAESRAQLEGTRVARPLMRRIVRSLMEETDADPTALLRVGEALARGTEGENEATLLRAYAEMGLGTLTRRDGAGERAAYEGTDLFERAPGSRRTTCYLALGFLVGVVRRVHGAAAVGTETTCESRGDACCSFVVVARPEGRPVLPSNGGPVPAPVPPEATASRG